jgi:hypothetical protein
MTAKRASHCAAIRSIQLFKDREMLDDGLPAHRRLTGQHGGRRRSVDRDPVEQMTPGGLGQRGEELVDGLQRRGRHQTRSA